KQAAAAKMASDVLAKQASIRAALAAADVEVFGAVQNVLNAVFIRASCDQAKQVQAMAGVRRVTRSRQFKPLINEAELIVGAPEARNVLGGENNAGAGLR